MSDLPILDELRGDLLAAMHAAEAPSRSRLRSLRPILLAALLVVLLAATAAATTYYILRASPIAPFKPTDTTPEQRVAPGTSRVLDLRSPDPGGAAPPWALRLARSQTGLLCGTVGQVDGDEFGIVGLDGRFRALPEPNADACGEPDADGLALLGTRVFDSDNDAEVRTVVNGAGGPKLERATIAVRGGAPEPLELGPEGGFLRAYTGFPEDLQPVVTLHFAGGRTRRHALATSPFVVPDPLGGPAWKIEASVGGGPERVERHHGRTYRLPVYSCMQFSTARYRERTSAMSPALCGRDRHPVDGPDRTLYYGARRLDGGRRVPSDILAGRWNRHEPRTAIWGNAGRDTVSELVITGPDGLRRTVRPIITGAFLVVLDPQVDPATLHVEVRFKDGRLLRTGPDHGLVDRRKVVR
jgi:hypothetical protein